MPVPQQESSQDHLIAPRIYIFTILVAELFLTSFATTPFYHLQFSVESYTMMFYPSLLPCFLSGSSLFCPCPFFQVYVTDTHIYLLQLSPSELCTAACTWDHLMLMSISTWMDKVELCIFPFNLMPFPALSPFICTAISLPPSVSLLVLCLKDFKLLPNLLLFPMPQFKKQSFLSKPKTLPLLHPDCYCNYFYSFPKYSAPPQHRQLFPE